ncbi:thiol-disulfide oxidoreductase DCC family protein [Salinicoccus sp. HZC-1]|uniref:thiol-disulfide oxidoreductase DCC family protein n=1 Tax=Salinicoccus sp. HZC-1 TaxID=3385497 RepID=UPI00398B3D50
MNILYFDDKCIVCNGFAKMVSKLDRRDIIRFASVDELKEVMPEDFDTVAYYSDDLYIHSDAVIEVVADATGFKFIRLSKIMPKCLRTAIYKFVAKNRHKLTGNKTCEIDQIDSEVKKKMISS